MNSDLPLCPRCGGPLQWAHNHAGADCWRCGLLIRLSAIADLMNLPKEPSPHDPG